MKKMAKKIPEPTTRATNMTISAIVQPGSSPDGGCPDGIITAEINKKS